MIRFFTCIIMLALLFSCKKDRGIEPNDIKLTGLLKSYSVMSNGNEEKYSFEYVDSLTIKSITHTINGKSLTELFEYANDTLRTSTVGDTLKKYIYSNGRLRLIEKHLIRQEGTYEVTIFTHNGSGKVNNIERRRITKSANTYLGETSYSWNGENILLAKERFPNGLIEEYNYQYDESLNPLTELYSKILRIPSEITEELSKNNPSASMAFFSGDRLRMEGKYLENKFPQTRTTSILKESDTVSDWKTLKEYTFSYHE